MAIGKLRRLELPCKKGLLRTCLFKGGCKCITLSKKQAMG
jgi:hypothetical protein